MLFPSILVKVMMLLLKAEPVVKDLTDHALGPSMLQLTSKQDRCARCLI